MKQLITSSGFAGYSPLEKHFWDLVGDKKNSTVAFIPTAGDKIERVDEKPGSDHKVPKFIKNPQIKNYKEYNWFKKNGFKVIVVDLKEEKKKIKEKLSSADIIFVGGGDINYLLDWAKKAGVGKYIKKLLDKDIIYISVSAGGGLVSHDIGLTWWEQGMKDDHKSFGINDFVVVVHQKESDKSKNIKSLKKRLKYYRTIVNFPWKVYLVKDGQAIKVDGGKIEHVGRGIKKFI